MSRIEMSERELKRLEVLSRVSGGGEHRAVSHSLRGRPWQHANAVPARQNRVHRRGGGRRRGGNVLGAILANSKTRESSVMLLMVDNRSGVQISASEGSASKTDWGGMGSLFGNRTANALRTFQRDSNLPVTGRHAVTSQALR